MGPGSELAHQSARHAASAPGGRRWLATAFLAAGRVLLPLGPVVICACRMTRSQWAGASVTADSVIPDHWIPQGAFVLLFVWSLLLPFLILPIGSVALATIDDNNVRLPTVLGTRTVPRKMLKITRFRVPGRGYDLQVSMLHGSRRLPVFIGSSDLWSDDGDHLPAVHAAEETQHRTRAARIGGAVLSWLGICVWACAALIAFSLAGAAAAVI